MLRKSIMMMTSSGTNWDLVGAQTQANAYYGYVDSPITIQVVYENFVGGFGIQGTLSTDPKPEDWFWINIGGNSNPDNNKPYITFPENSTSTTGRNGGDTGSKAFTFQGNFVYLRAVVTRDYIGPPPAQIQYTGWTFGQVDRVMLSL